MGKERKASKGMLKADPSTSPEVVSNAAEHVASRHAVIDDAWQRISETLRNRKQRLRDSEDRYRIVSEFSPDWDFWVGPDQQYRFVAPACEAICGYPATAFLADPLLMERLLHPEEVRQWRTHWDTVRPAAKADQSCATGHEHHAALEFRLRHRDGHQRWIEHQCCPVYDADGRYQGRRGVNRDITARKTAEAQAAHITLLYATLSQTNQAIVRARSSQELLASVARIVVTVGGFQGCAITLLDPESGRPRLAAHHGLEAPNFAGTAFAEFAAGAAITRSMGAPAEGASEGSRRGGGTSVTTGAGESGLGREAHYALQHQDQCIGVLSILAGDSHGDSHGDSEGVQSLLQQLAADVSRALDYFAEEAHRTAMEAALRDSEARYRRMVETTHEGVWSLDAELRVTHVNDALLKILGHSREAVLGHSGLDFLFPEDREGQLQRMHQHRAGRSETFEVRLCRSDGHAVSVLVSATPLWDANGAFEGAFAILRDLSLHREAEAALQKNLLLRGLFEHSPVAMILFEGAGQQVAMINRVFRRKLGYSKDDLPDAAHWWQLAYPDPNERARLLQTWQDRLKGAANETGYVRPLEARITCRDGTVRQFQVHAAVIGEDHLAVLVDITALRRTEEQLSEASENVRLASRAFESAGEGLAIIDADTRVVTINPAFTDITGYAGVDMIGRRLDLVQPERHGPGVYAGMQESLQQTGRWGGEVWDRRKNGEDYPLWLTVANVGDHAGLTTHHIVALRDLAVLRQSEAQVAFMDHHDRLTQLPNWALLMDRLHRSLERVTQRNQPLGVLFIDLDRFKKINDSLGHAVGDGLLRLVAQRLSHMIRVSDTLARIGGDEFVILVEGQGSVDRLLEIARKIGALFLRPFVFETHELFVTASIGISVYPQDARDAATLIKHADLAMYQAKAQGRNGYQFYRPEMAAEADERLTLENALRGALRAEQFEPYFQPQVDLETGALTGAEVLLRWHHPELGTVSPGLFIPIAEDMGIIGDIGAWVLEAACRQVMLWEAEGLHVPRIAVNLSVQQVESDSLVRLVQRVLRDTGLPATQLELEITESMIMRQAERAILALTDLRALGVEVAVDDFGTGYSSLGYLQRLPLNRLKIDYAFVRDIGRSRDDETIARAIIGLGRSLGLEVIAEGVEREEQADFLREEGCEIGQGYLFGHPMPADDFLASWTGPGGEARQRVDRR